MLDKEGSCRTLDRHHSKEEEGRRHTPRTDKLWKRGVNKDPFVTAKEFKDTHTDDLGEVVVRTVTIN